MARVIERREKKGGGGFIPGFGVGAVVGAVGLTFILHFREKKEL